MIHDAVQGRLRWFIKTGHEGRWVRRALARQSSDERPLWPPPLPLQRAAVNQMVWLGLTGRALPAGWLHTRSHQLLQPSPFFSLLCNVVSNAAWGELDAATGVHGSAPEAMASSGSYSLLFHFRLPPAAVLLCIIY